MPDIQLRFHKDMLVLSAPLDAALARQGINAATDRQYLNLMEPDSIRDALRLEEMAGAHCLVTTTEDITQARLAHLRMDSDAARLAQASVAVANELKPQHVLVEVGPCGLPLDASSKASLNENRAQYANAARAFAGLQFDAFFLNGFSSLADLRCALMGVAQVSDKPVFASVAIGGSPSVPPGETPGHAGGFAGEESVFEGLFGDKLVAERSAPIYVPGSSASGIAPDEWVEAVDVMVDLGASVVGFETAEPIGAAVEYARAAVSRTGLPVLAQLRVLPEPADGASAKLAPLAAIDDYTPDTLVTAAVKLYGAGVQFLRATGMATPAYTGALAATVMGLDVHRPQEG